MHQRSCKTIEGLAKQLTTDLCEELANHDPEQNEIIDYGNSGPPLIKTGVKLPETNQDWQILSSRFTWTGAKLTMRISTNVFKI